MDRYQEPANMPHAPRFSKEDCGKEMTQQEMRDEQILMLDAIADFCDENGLRYFLSGGTLLGAIRHKGYIPWDDDMDVNIPRPDCEKLLTLSNGKIGDYIFVGPDMDQTDAGCEFYRLYHPEAVIENFASGYAMDHPTYRPLFVDVFPIEGLPDSKFVNKLHYMKLVALRKMQRSSFLEHNIARTRRAKVFHVVSRIPAKIVGYKRWSMAIQNTAMKYDFEESKYVGVMTAGVHTTEERVLKDDYLKVIDVSFEKRMYHAPGNYDTYLSQLYGDYMTLPPIEKQSSGHMFRIYWRKKLNKTI